MYSRFLSFVAPVRILFGDSRSVPGCLGAVAVAGAGPAASCEAPREGWRLLSLWELYSGVVVVVLFFVGCIFCVLGVVSVFYSCFFL